MHLSCFTYTLLVWKGHTCATHIGYLHTHTFHCVCDHAFELIATKKNMYEHTKAAK